MAPAMPCALIYVNHPSGGCLVSEPSTPKPISNARANGPRTALNEKSAENATLHLRKKFWMCTRVDSAGGGCVNKWKQAKAEGG
jgi:hypothetical protein